MKVYLVRHGETTGNLKNFHQLPETPLTEAGVVQAKSVAKRLKNCGVDLVYSSPNKRAVQTAEIISGETGAPVEAWGNLTEIRRPKEIVGKSGDDPEIKKIENLLVKNFGKSNWKYSDEENFEDLSIRAKAVFDHLLKNHDNQTVVCVSHGTFIKVLAACAIFGDSLNSDTFNTLRIKMWAGNTGVTILDHDEKHGWRLLSWNDTSHL